MTEVELICSGCSKSFKKPKKEYDRQVRKGKISFYCTRQCFGVYVSPKNLQTEKALAWRNSDEFKTWQTQQVQRQKDSVDPFRPYMKLIRSHNKADMDIEIDLDYIKKLWLLQEGRCAYSGLLMEHPTWGYTDPFKTASIDRIDSSKGYVIGNVQFIVRALNWAKNNSTDHGFKNFLRCLATSLTSAVSFPK